MEAQTKRSTALARWITGRQNYYLKVRGAPPSDGLSIISVKAIERLGSPYHITLELTANVELARADYLGHNATFSIEPLPGDGTPRDWNGKRALSRDFRAGNGPRSGLVVAAAECDRRAVDPRSRLQPPAFMGADRSASQSRARR
ncbi:hypothetical protein [Caballeronia sp. AZ1_KS37]|uniref:hypothetical protein n=1 Tax=Caballeronia sp. AZ1_KS37 TaxID=2921756 RepID=UPI0020285FFF|nr:hypothetical protein [Caballeronia sp. AZ1_KS37]